MTNAGLLTRDVFSGHRHPDRLVVLAWTGLLRATGDTTLFGHHPPKRRPSSPSATPSPPTTRRPAHHAQAGGVDLRSKELPCTPSTDPSTPRLRPLAQLGSHHALTAIKNSSHGSRACRALYNIPHVANYFYNR
jgi:hypothetical protein